MRVTVDGLEMSYRVRGEGPPLLLVAGTGYPGATWAPETVDGLAAASTVVTYDHRGTGATPGTDGDYSTRLLARDALGLVAALGFDTVDVLGHSMGGRVAQWMAIDGGATVRSLVLAASGAGAGGGTAGHAVGLPLRAVQQLVELGYEGYIRDQQRRTFFTDDFCTERPEAVAWLADAFWLNRPALPDYLKHVVARQQHDTADLLPRIGQPSLVLVGDLDTHAGGTGSHVEQSRHLAQRLPRADLVLLRGVKHGFLWERPVESTATVRQWLDAAAR